MKSETVLEMVRRRIKELGHDGLFNPGTTCCCLLDDLAPCGEITEDCTSGFKAPCSGSSEDGFCDGMCDFHVEAAKGGE